MKTLFASLLFVLAMGVCLQAEDKPAAQPDQAAMEKIMMEMAKLGPHHEYFKKLAGDWTTKATEFSSGDDNPPVSKGTARFELLMDGRYLRQTFKSEFHGMPFEGIGHSGYDNAQQKYVGTWMDNFSTGIMQTKGTLDEKTGVMTEIGEATSPIGTMKFKMVTEMPSDDTMKFTMSMIGPDDSETKHMVIEYTRKD